MCGIAGLNRNPEEHFDTRAVAAAMLLSIESRGKDATGAAWFDGKHVGLSKMAWTAKRFVKERIGNVPTDALNLVLHTRAWTQGKPSARANNHPITSGRIVGVHNGWVFNDYEIFRELGAAVTRRGQVDSEAIFALIDASDEHPTKVLGRIDGAAAIAWIDRDRPRTLQLAKTLTSPLCIAQTKGGSLLFASTMAAIDAGAKAGGLTIAWRDELDQGEYLRVLGGVIHDRLNIPNLLIHHWEREGSRARVRDYDVAFRALGTPAATSVKPKRKTAAKPARFDEAAQEAHSSAQLALVPSVPDVKPTPRRKGKVRRGIHLDGAAEHANSQGSRLAH